MKDIATFLLGAVIILAIFSILNSKKENFNTKNKDCGEMCNGILLKKNEDIFFY